MAAVAPVWGAIDPGGDWAAQWSRLVLDASIITASAQLGAAIDGAASVPASLVQSGFPEEQLASVNPAGFAGWMQADNGAMVDLPTAMLAAPIVRARTVVGEPEQKLSSGLAVLMALAQVAVADASRHAATAQGAATRNTVNVFYDPPPMCQRCAVLVGRRYKWGTQFARHPRCDGQTQIMSERDESLLPMLGLDDVTDLTQAQRKAIEDGADFNQVVNSQTRPTGGRTPRSPLTGDGRTYAGGGRSRGATRQTPASIYAEAGGDRQRAIDLLRANGYIR